MNGRSILMAGGWLLAFSAGLAGTVFGQITEEDVAQVERLQSTLAEIADEVRPSVVAVRAHRRINLAAPENERSSTPSERDPGGLPIEQIVPSVGSGMVIDGAGLILTNEHVVHNADPADIECVVANGESYPVEGITTDPRSDLAVLRIEAENLKPVRLGDLSEVRQGYFAIVLGNPFGSAYEGSGRPSMSFGIISALGQVLTPQLDPLDQRYYGNLIQTDAPINPGNSGGPLLNIKGEVIGITTAISTRSGGSQGIGYAIAIDARTKDIISKLARGERVGYGYLGISLDLAGGGYGPAKGAATRQGAWIKEVSPDTPAAAANLRPGDCVVAFDGQPIVNGDHLIRQVGATPVGRQVSLSVIRDGRQIDVTISLASRDVPKGIHFEPDFAWRGLLLTETGSTARQRFPCLPEHAQGIVVVMVESGSEAEKVGFKPGQLIESVNQQRMGNLRPLRQFARTNSGPARITIAGVPPVELLLP
ncbi:MAG: PDZ domain-containing protein [Phycisphaerales bacterium]|nr:PDZ domain-containing protein [Phycisphaerales bacterium]